MIQRARQPFLRSAFFLLAVALAGSALSAQSGATPAGGAAGAAAPAVDEAAETAAMTVVTTIDAAVESREPLKIKPVFATLDDKWAKLTPKTLKRVTKSLGAMFAKLKPMEQRDVDTMGDDARNGRFNPDGDAPDPKVDNQKQDVFDCYHSAIGLLYDKPDGPAVLLPVLKLTHVKTWPEVQVLILEGLGFRAEPGLEKDIEAYLRHENATVASAAAEALGRLRDQPLDVRRRATSSIVDALGAAMKACDKEAAKLGENDEHPAKRYLSLITVKFSDALVALTHQTFGKPAEWCTWFAAHGKDATW